MDALRSSVSPKPNRMKSDDGMKVEEATVNEVEVVEDDKPPAWAINQAKILHQWVGMVKGLQTYMEEVKEELAEVNQ